MFLFWLLHYNFHKILVDAEKYVPLHLAKQHKSVKISSRKMKCLKSKALNTTYFKSIALVREKKGGTTVRPQEVLRYIYKINSFNWLKYPHKWNKCFCFDQALRIWKYGLVRQRKIHILKFESNRQLYIHRSRGKHSRVVWSRRV